MCGIAGYFSSTSAFSRDILELMASRIAHRGPDASGTFVHKSCGLAHRRLSIIDLSAEANQPMHSACGRYVIAYNGESYNYRELAQKEKLSLRTASDTEVLLQLFIQKGPEFIREVNGMFALAIYDREKEELWLYRDRMGIKPLFLYEEDQHFAFASELKSLLALPDIARDQRYNREAIGSFLHLGYIPEPLTFYQNIQKFPAGSYACISAKGMEIKRYWQASDALTKEPISDFTTASKELEERLQQSVAYRLRSDVPFGAFLSGGIDSSLVAALAQKQLSQSLKTFTIAFDHQKFNEAHFAQKVSQHLGTEHHEFKVTQQTAKELVSEILPLMDEPFADTSIIPTLMVSKLAAKEVKMTLSGDGGDELFMGYGAYNWAQRLRQPAVRLARYPMSWMLKLGQDRSRRAAKVFQYRYKDHLPAHIFSQEQYFFSQKELEFLGIAPDFGYELYAPKELKRRLNAQEKQAYFDLHYYLKDDLLVKVDRATMHYGLESRVPLLDHKVVEYALNIDSKLKMQQGQQKYILKELLYRYVPRELFDRPKWGFSIPMVEWLQNDLRYLIEENLNKQVVMSVGLISYTYTSNLVDLYLNKGHHHLYNRLWALILLHMHLR